MKIIARFSGVVTYDNGSSQSFAAHLDDQGNLSVNYSLENTQALYQVTNDKTWVQSMLGRLSGSVTLTPTTGSTIRATSDLTCELSGRIAYDDQTWGDFIVQYVNGAFIPTGGDVAHWTAARANSTALAALDSLFEAVTGVGNAVVA